jgi:hypothetical protein
MVARSVGFAPDDARAAAAALDQMDGCCGRSTGIASAG